MTMKRGSLLLEAMVAIGVFAIFLAGIGLALVLGEKSTIMGGDRARASARAEEQIAAVRQVQEDDFDAMTEGQHGIALIAGEWTFSGTSIIEDGMTSFVTIEEMAEDHIRVTSTVSWNFGQSRSGSVVLVTQMTNWHAPLVVGDWSSISLDGSVSQGGSPSFNDVLVIGQYAYVTAGVAPGLFVYDVSSATPVRVATSFDLGAGSYAIAAAGDDLVLVTSDGAREVVIIDLDDPMTLTSDDISDQYDLPGTAGGRSVATYADLIFVGLADDTANPQFHALIFGDGEPLDLLDSMSVSGSVLGISLNSGYALLSTDANTAELQVIDVIVPEDLLYAPGVGVDMTDAHDALSVATSGTSALLGRSNGSSIDELTLYDIGLSPVPSPPPGPWTLEIGGSAEALGVIDGTRYAFVGGTASSAQIRVIDLVRLSQNGSPVIIETVNAGGSVYGLSYDWATDRLFAVTTNALLVYAPN